jgi:hypothetical protein
MVVFYIILAVVVVGAGLFLAKTHNLHLTTFAIAAAAALLVPAPVYALTTSIAKNDQQTFHEYWNGFETAAVTQVDQCERDGSCKNTYQCDPYTVIETETYTDSKGNSRTRPVTRTKYHSCPYSAEETTYVVDTTLGSFTFADRLMTGRQWRDAGIPGGQVTAPPADWAAVKARIDAGQPGGVTQVNNYKNLILGSQQTLFKRYSDTIDTLTAENLLPAPSSGIQNRYDAAKAYFVGDLKGVDTAALTKNVQSLNGAVGAELRGDLHVVFVEADKLPMSPEDYSNALLAHWQSSVFGRDAISKNAIVVVVGVEGYKKPAAASVSPSEAPAVLPDVVPGVEVLPTPEATPEVAKPTIKAGTPVVAWAKAFTGMPIGNEGLLTQFGSQLPGTVVDENFIGSPTYDVAAGTVTHTDGAVESILYGENKFERVSMSAEDADDMGGGFAYLGDDWAPDQGTMTLIYVLSSILALAALAGGVYLSIGFRASRTNDFIAHLFSKSSS